MNDSYYKDHWLDIEPDRLDRYEAMFKWSLTAERVLAPADVGPGQTIADFGCGPGYAAVELAKRVGAGGHVHALDINARICRPHSHQGGVRRIVGQDHGAPVDGRDVAVGR